MENDDDNDNQALEKISIDFTTGHSWLIITPYLAQFISYNCWMLRKIKSCFTVWVPFLNQVSLQLQAFSTKKWFVHQVHSGNSVLFKIVVNEQERQHCNTIKLHLLLLKGIKPMRLLRSKSFGKRLCLL